MARRKPGLYDVCVGRAIKAARDIRKVSQDVLAAEIGISAAQLSKYEQGKSQISVSVLLEIQQALGVPVQLPSAVPSSGLSESQSTFDGPPPGERELPIVDRALDTIV